METVIRIGEKRFRVCVERRGDGWTVTSNGKSFSFSAAQRLGVSTWRLQTGNRHLTIPADLKPGQITLWLDGEKIAAQIEAVGAGRRGGSQTRPSPAPTDLTQGPFTLKSAMPGLVKKIKVKPGDRVQKGQGLLVLEAMKMENEIVSPVAGTVESVAVREKQSVEAQSILMRFS